MGHYRKKITETLIKVFENSNPIIKVKHFKDRTYDRNWKLSSYMTFTQRFQN